MPSGRVHNLINVAAYSALSAAALYATRQQLVVLTPLQTLSFSGAFMVGTFLMSPDLDLAEGQVDSKRRWGPLGFLWVPYGKMSSHRGLSHTWVLGPLLRLLYIGVIAALIWGVLLVLRPGTTLPNLPALFPQKILYPLLLGYYLSQWLHLIADGVRPDHGFQRVKRKRRRK